ncbi:tetratricopeptide repeat protein [Octadecabacter antarcticus]|uniref:tetratricopeptide repeat protein n=1 Tax=Octadecabacter antarcticus TaxID=1217908 RepID=UPI00018072A9|nr:tetratricopeptide repeat protein [Octadecabacter antarcticus]
MRWDISSFRQVLEKEFQLQLLKKIYVGLMLLTPMTALAQDFEAGLEAYTTGDYATANENWRPLAEQGDVVSQSYIGQAYLWGLGVQIDEVEGLKWLFLAAENGDASAQEAIGQHYLSDLEDFDRMVIGAKWYEMAGEQGHIGAQYQLYEIYMNGYGVEQDLAVSEMWHERFIAQLEPDNPYLLFLEHVEQGSGEENLAMDHCDLILSEFLVGSWFPVPDTERRRMHRFTFGADGSLEVGDDSGPLRPSSTWEISNGELQLNDRLPGRLEILRDSIMWGGLRYVRETWISENGVLQGAFEGHVPEECNSGLPAFIMGSWMPVQNSGTGQTEVLTFNPNGTYVRSDGISNRSGPWSARDGFLRLDDYLESVALEIIDDSIILSGVRHERYKLNDEGYNIQEFVGDFEPRGVFEPESEITVGEYSLRRISLGGKDGFMPATSEGFEPAVYVEFWNESEEIKMDEAGNGYRADQLRFEVTSYEVSSEKLSFRGYNEVLGDIFFSAEFDGLRVESQMNYRVAGGARPKNADEPILIGDMMVGGHIFYEVPFELTFLH